MTIRSFNPPIRTLMGPGPSDINPRVLQAMGRPTIGHLDPQFIVMMDELKVLLQNAFQTKNELTMPVSAPGSAGMESCFVNLVQPGDEVIIARNGVFGTRMEQNVLRTGGKAIMVDDEWGHPCDPNKIEEALKANPNASVVAFVHAETSTGASSDAKTITQLAHNHDCLTIVDTVTSLGGSELQVDEWNLDAVYSGSQKCLSCTPGLSPVTFSDRAVDRIKNRKHPVQSWFLDLNLVMGYWGAGAKRSYHHTAPVNSLYALHESLVILSEEGLEASWKRHRTNHRALRVGLESMGIQFQVAPDYRLPQLNAVVIPDGVEDAAVRKALLQEYNLEIGGGLGSGAGKVWRIGLMGHASNETNVLTCLGALDAVLGDMGASFERGKAVASAREYYASI